MQQQEQQEDQGRTNDRPRATAKAAATDSNRNGKSRIRTWKTNDRGKPADSEHLNELSPKQGQGERLLGTQDSQSSNSTGGKARRDGGEG